ncbi:MAG: hypothetical protein ABGY41_03065, partial [Candidatus Poribacteria bacterium]
MSHEKTRMVLRGPSLRVAVAGSLNLTRVQVEMPFLRLPGDFLHDRSFRELQEGRVEPCEAQADFALAGGGRVAVFAPDGSEQATIPVPQPMVTSLRLGRA